MRCQQVLGSRRLSRSIAPSPRTCCPSPRPPTSRPTTHHCATSSSILAPPAPSHTHNPAQQQSSLTTPTPTTTSSSPALHPTLDLLRSRLTSGSQPGSRSDGFRLGLVVEGGGMRGVVSGAMLMALRDLGLAHAFDAVYGSSAGAINAAYFLTGQEEGLHIYTQELAKGDNFLDLRRLFAPGNTSSSASSSHSFPASSPSSPAPRPAMDLDFLFGPVMRGSVPLDWPRLLASSVPLKVVASCLDSAQAVTLEGFADEQELEACLRASATVPVVAGGPVHVRGRRLVDAAVFEPVPTQAAVRDGCTHVLVLCTRPAPPVQGGQERERTGSGSSLLSGLFGGVMCAVREGVEAGVKRLLLNAPYMGDTWALPQSAVAPREHDRALAAAARGCPAAARAELGAWVLPVHPPHTAGCTPVCQDPETLLAGMDVGRRALLAALEPLGLAAGVEGQRQGQPEGQGQGQGRKAAAGVLEERRSGGLEGRGSLGAGQLSGGLVWSEVVGLSALDSMDVLAGAGAAA